MSIEVDGVTYYSAADVLQEIGVSRQTLWRWRHEGKVPGGRRYRDKQILFTRGEVQQIRDYANRLEPLQRPAPDKTEHFEDKRGNR